MTTLSEIKLKLGDHKKRLFQDYPIKSMAIFGSYSRSDHSKTSDLDILVEFTDKIGIRFVDLAEEIERILGLKVDLVSRNGVKKKYLDSIHSDLVYV